jgi:cell division protein FtsB
MADNTIKRTETEQVICRIGVRQLFFIVSLCLVSLFVIAGCENKASQTQKQSKPVLSPASIQQENTKIKAENEQLKKQIETLTGIDKPVRIDAISTVSMIELTDRSGIRSKTKDSNDVNETLVVYLKTIDDMGDVVKAPGQAKVELWDLNAKPAEALLGSWTVEPANLKKSWSGSFMTNYYKLTFDANAIPKDQKRQELTLKAEFTDYMSGKILKAQKVIK